MWIGKVWARIWEAFIFVKWKKGGHSPQVIRWGPLHSPLLTNVPWSCCCRCIYLLLFLHRCCSYPLFSWWLFFSSFSLLFRDWFYSSGRMCVYVRARGWLKENVQKGLATIVVVSAAIDDGIWKKRTTNSKGPQMKSSFSVVFFFSSFFDIL